jgi:hypothetical protein
MTALRRLLCWLGFHPLPSESKGRLVGVKKGKLIVIGYQCPRCGRAVCL